MKILYAASGEGMGHATRSETVINSLIKDHEVIFCGGGKAYQYLRNKIKSYHLNCLFIIYRNNKATGFRTFMYNVFRLPKLFQSYFKLSKICKKFNPDIIISDFEPISVYYGLINKKKVISIDNQHIITKAKIDYPLRYFISGLNSKIVIRLMVPHTNTKLITTFFRPEINKRNTYYVAPIIREKIVKLKPKEKDYFLVYQTSDSNNKLIEMLQEINEKFIVYGFHKNKRIKNITLKKNDEDSFIADLKDCKAVIINGGFTLMSEALYLKKPILSIPVKEQFEQILNAIYLEKLGYGKFIETFSVEKFNDFVHNMKKYKHNLNKNPTIANDFKKILNEKIKN